jgi:hypothetical protein
VRKNDRELTSLVDTLRRASAQAAAMGIDITRAHVLRQLVLLHDLDFEQIRRFEGPGDARDPKGGRLEVKTALQGGTCQLGRIGPGSKSLERLEAVDGVLFAWFARVDPLRVLAAYRVASRRVVELAMSQAGNGVVENVSIGERWASLNGTRLEPRTRKK